MAITLTSPRRRAACSTNDPPGGEGRLSIATAGSGGVYPPAFEEPRTLGPGLDLRAGRRCLLTALRRGIRITARTNDAGRLVRRVSPTRSIARRLGFDKRVVGSLAQIVTAGRICIR